jgi:protein-disulfide isomerase
LITRRDFIAGTSSLAIVAALSTSFALPSLAQGPSELMVPPVLGEMWLGKEDAPVTVIEYASLWCSHCAHFHKEVYPDLKKRYIDTGKIRFIFREFPLNIRGAAGSALARCFGKDKYFAMVDLLFEQQDKWAFVQDPIPPLLAIARQAGMSEESFKGCLNDKKILDGLQGEQDRAAKKFGVESTPTVFVNGKKVPDIRTVNDLAKVIDPLLPKS